MKKVSPSYFPRNLNPVHINFRAISRNSYEECVFFQLQICNTFHFVSYWLGNKNY